MAGVLAVAGLSSESDPLYPFQNGLFCPPSFFAFIRVVHIFFVLICVFMQRNLMTKGGGLAASPLTHWYCSIFSSWNHWLEYHQIL